jgi:hypothetical protein
LINSTMQVGICSRLYFRFRVTDLVSRTYLYISERSIKSVGLDTVVFLRRCGRKRKARTDNAQYGRTVTLRRLIQLRDFDAKRLVSLGRS